MFPLHPPHPPKPAFRRMSGPLRDILRQARREALALGYDAVGAEHLLLALTALGVDFFARAGVDAHAVRDRLLALLPRGTAPAGGQDLPFVGARGVIEAATGEARAARRNLRASDVLIAITEDEGSPGAAILREFGITAEVVRRGAAGEVADGLLHLKIDEASDRSIFEQIVDGVQEAVATGKLRPGERLPSVRRLADRLDVAPGTVARAYTELERRAVVVTEGARGTRVAERSAAPGAAEALDGLLKPVVVAAFHMGATLRDLRSALDRASRGILDKDPGA